MFDYAGSLHFHSVYSYDAYLSMDSIVRDALGAGLDFAILTDHFNLDARRDGWEKYHEADGRKMMLLVGEEISPRYNHYLALQLKSPIVTPKIELHPQETIDAVNAQGGFGFIAHPDHTGATYAGVRAYPWVNWDVKGFAGMSIWDLIGDWVSTLTSPWGVLCGLFCPARVLNGPRIETLRRWDELTQTQHVVAIGEVDNHGTRKHIFGIPKILFPFRFAFRTIRTHVVLAEPLSGTFEMDAPIIYSALREGRSYVSFDLWKDPKGFQFEIFDDRERVTMGGRITRRGPLLVDIKLPATGRIRLIRNGRVIREEGPRAYMQRDIELPGVYRLQVDQKIGGRWRPWIFSNPIWVD